MTKPAARTKRGTQRNLAKIQAKRKAKAAEAEAAAKERAAYKDALRKKSPAGARGKKMKKNLHMVHHTRTQVKNCTIITTNLGFKEWNDFLQNKHLTAALIDRLTDNGHVINIASGKPVTVRKVIDNIRMIIGGGSPVFGEIPFRPGENMELYADISKAKELLDWEPVVSLNEGLERTIKYYS